MVYGNGDETYTENTPVVDKAVAQVQLALAVPTASVGAVGRDDGAVVRPAAAGVKGFVQDRHWSRPLGRWSGAGKGGKRQSGDEAEELHGERDGEF